MNVFVQFGITLLVAFVSAAMVSVFAQRKARMPLIISARASGIMALSLAFAYIAIFGTLSILRHQSFHSGGEDLGVFDQVIWNSLRGRLFEGTILVGFASKLGNHFSPILLALVPFYALWADPQMLLILQTLALALGALPLYWFAKKRLDATFAVILVAAYFLYPPVQYTNLFEFHEIALATPLLAFAIYFLLLRRYTPFLICLFLALQTKEEIAFIVVAYGLFLFVVQRNYKLGAGIAVAGALWGMALLLYVIPFFRGPANASYFFVERYQYLGKDIPEIVRTIVTQPGLVLEHLLAPPKIEFVLQLLVPLAFIPLGGASVLALALPTLAYLLISDNPYQTSIRFQYTAPIIPMVFFALILGLERVNQWNRIGRLATKQLALVTIIGTASLINYYFQSAGPLGQHYDPAQYTLNARTELGHQLVRLVPANASVVADSNLVPHLSQRATIYQAPVVPDLRKIEYLLVDRQFPPHSEYAEIWNAVIETPFFETVVERDGYIVKKRAAVVVQQPRQIHFDNRITLMGYSIEYSVNMARLILVWRADQPIRERYIIFVHLLDVNERIWSQGDREPANGWLRTDRWETGDVIPDRYTLELPAELPPGIYSIAVGLYDVATGARLNTVDGQDSVMLTSINLTGQK